MRRLEKLLRVAITVIFLLSNSKISIVSAADLVTFAGFNTQNISFSASNWDLAVDANLSGSSIIMTGDAASATFIIDISSIADSVDLEHLKIDFSTNAQITAIVEGETYNASVEIGFGPDSSTPANIPSIDQGLTTPGALLPLTSNASIPKNTKFIFVTLKATNADIVNNIVFSDISLFIRDEQAPTLSYSLIPASWTSSAVEVSFSAADEISGIEGIYNSLDQKVTSFSTSENGTWQFTARDFAGNVSTPIDVEVNTIDTAAPETPVLDVDTTAWTNAPVGFTISEVAAGTSPDVRQFRLNTGEWQTYIDPATVGLEGISTLDARTIDAAGNVSGTSTATIQVDLTSPAITLTSDAHAQPLGGATVTVGVVESLSGLAATKYEVGSQTADYFASAGTVLTEATFDVVSGGVYTVFAQDNAGNTAVEEISVNTYPSIDKIDAQTMTEDIASDVHFSVHDLENLGGELVVTAESSDESLFQSITVSNNAGDITLALVPASDLHGNAVITVSVSDSGLLVTEHNFDITVNAVNDDPITGNETVSTNEDQPITIDVLNNDTDADILLQGDSLTIVSVSEGVNGDISITEGGKKIEYAPKPNVVGSEDFTYTIRDAQGSEAIGTVSMTIVAQNDAPIVSDISNQTVNEDTSTGALLFTATDADGNTLVITGTSSNLSVVPNANITFGDLGSGNYTVQVLPATDKTTWNSDLVVDEPVTITIKVDDGTVIVEKSFTLSVSNVNDPPAAADNSGTTDENTPVEINVLTNDSDPEGSTLSVTVVGTPAHGSAEITGGGLTVTYTPSGDYNGTDTFTYTVSDGSGSTQANVNITIQSINDAPVAVDDTLTMNEDGSQVITPLGNDSDADVATNGDHLVITEVTGAVHGGVELAADGLSLTYTPAANWSGSEVLEYTISDDGHATDTANITITVQAVNDGPTANADTISTNEDIAVQIDVLANDTDVDTADTLTIYSFTVPTNGSVEFVDNGTKLKYTPHLNWNGSDAFTYILRDSQGLESTASVAITVNPIDDAPVITAPANQTIEEDNGTGALAFSVSDVEADILAVSAVSNNQDVIKDVNVVVTDLLNGGGYTIAINPILNTNTWTGSAHAPVTITISAFDGVLTTTATFTVTVNPVNDEPVVVVDSATTNEDTPVVISVLTNDSDIESDSLSVSGVGSAAHGTVAITDEGQTVTYTPVSNYNGSDSFTYTASDGSGSSTSTVSITVTSVNDAPAAVTDSISLNEDVVTTINVLANDTDVDMTSNPGMESLTIDSVASPSHGSTVISDNKVVYTPVVNYNGPDSFTYVVRDIDGATATGTVNLTINSVNDYPTFSSLNAEYTLNEDDSITIHFNITDVETPTESLMLQVTSGNTTKVPNSRLELDGLGNVDADTSLTITPVANQNGDVVITLRLGDGFVVTVATFTLHITPVNDNPVARSDTINFTEDQSVVIDMDSLVANDTDIDADTLTYVSFDDSGMQGSLTVLNAGDHTYTFAPPANYDQNTSFQYTMTDGTTTSSATVTLRATAINDAPTIVMDGGNPTTTNEDTNITLAFTIHDQETAVSALTVVAGSSNTDILAPANITINCDAAGLCSLEAHPNPNKNGPVTITASVSDGTFLIPSSVDVTFTPVNDNPSAENDIYSVSTSGSQLVSPMENDYDVDGNTFSITSVDTTGMTGSLTDNLDGTYTYTPPAHFVGPQTFTYTITDSTGLTDSAIVTLNGASTNTAPTISRIVDQSTMEDTTSSAFAFTVTDPEGDAITITPSSSEPSIVPSDTSHIVVVESPVGSGNYTVQIIPAANAFGDAIITLTANDGAADTIISFTLSVYPVNDLPSAVTDDISTNEDTPITFDPLSNDTDLESALTIVAMSTPDHGLLTVSGADYTYSPHGNFYGSDTLTYTITDGESTATGTINITINSVNDNPVARNDWVTLANTTGANKTINVLSNDDTASDSGETLTVESIVTPPVYGTAVIVGNQVVYTRTSEPGDSHDSFVYRIADNGDPILYATATVYIAESWSPSINAENVSYARNEDVPQFTITLPISDGVGGGWTLELLNTATLGVTTIPNVNGNTITYTPNLNAFGSETLQYKVTSITQPAITDTANIYITLYPVNDLPTITAVSNQAIDEDTTTTPIAVTIADVDDPVSELKFAIYSGDQTLVSNQDIHFDRALGDITFTVTPILNRNGLVTISMLASDSVGYTAGTFDLTVTPVNDAPNAVDYNMSLSEDSSKTMTVIPPFADVEDDELTLTIATAPTHGGVVINGDKTVTYTPYANYFGLDNFVYQLDDEELGGVDTGTVSITVTPVNDGPVISNLVYLHETSEDTPEAVTFTVSDIDNTVASLVLTFVSGNETLIPPSAISDPVGEANKTITLTPAVNLSGESIITIRLSDGSLYTEQQFKLVVDSVNDLPVAVADSTSTNEDTAVTLNVLTNDHDVEDSSLDVASVTSPSHGSVVNNRNGTVTYMPTHNWNGTDSFTYTIVDDNNGTATATVTVVVNAINDAPSAVTDTVNINEDGPIIISPLANDSDFEGDTITLVSHTNPAKGVLQDNGDSTVTYTPTYDVFGADSFTYVISDGLLTSTGTVNINITAINDAPRLTSSDAAPWTMLEDTPTSFPINIYDPETPSDNLVIKITSSDQTLIPDTSIHLQGSGSDKTLLLTPNLNKFGTLDIQIEATDGELTTTEIFPVEILSMNDLPTISNVTDHSIPEDSTSPAYTFTVYDIETAATDLTITAHSANGTLIPDDQVVVTHTGGGNRTVKITPAANLIGTSSITLTVHDADSGTSNDSFTMTVTPVNDPPVANADTASVNEDASVSIDVLSNDTDVDLAIEGDNLTIVSTAGVDNGAVVIAEDNKSISFTPSANWNGTEVFTYTIRDTAGSTASASVTVTVAPVNDPPQAVNDTAATNEETAVVVNVLTNDTDIDLSREGDNLTISSTANVENGSVVIAGNGKSLTFTPALDWSGEETFDYTIKDQHDATSTAQVIVTVNATNDPPIISDIPDQIIAEDGNSGAISFTVSDVDTAAASLTVSVTTANGTVIPTGNVVFGGSGTDRTVTISPVLDKNTWNKTGSIDNPILLTVTVSDGALTDSDTLNVSVTPLNDAPVANADTASVNEDNPVTILALANDTDVDIANEGDSITITSYAAVDNGTVTIAGDGLSLAFTPTLNWNGVEVFSYTITDSHGLTSTANITVTVNAVNDTPTIVATVDQTINEDTNTGAITFTIDDVDNTAASLTVTRASSNTTVIPLANVVLGGSGASRTVTVTPAANKNTWNKTTLVNNPVTITITVKDTSNATVIDTFLVTVLKVNDAPVAVNDSITIPEDGSSSISVLANDTDVDISNEGDDLTILSTANVENGVVVVAGDNKSLTFTPTANWNGTEVFNYTVKDAAGLNSTATVTVTVTPSNDPPTISDIPNQSINEDSNTGAISFTVNDIDDAPADLTLSAITANGTIVPLSGVVFGGSGTDRTVTVTPALDRNTYISGPILVTATVTDTGGLTASDTFTMTVTALNDAPIAVADAITMDEDSSQMISVLTNDTDADLANENDNLTILSTAGVDNGSVTIAGDKKTLTFTPNPNWRGVETFTYTIRDDANSQSTANVTVTVVAANDAPDAFNDSGTTNEDTAITVDVLANDTDSDLAQEGDELTIVSTSGVDNGSVAIATDKKTLTFTPAANWNGTETFTYIMRDVANATSSASVTITVNAINDGPSAQADALTIAEDQTTTVTVLANDTDVDLSREGDNLLIIANTDPDAAAGTVAIDGDSKTVIFDPAENWYGIASFDYTIEDKSGLKSTATVTITVNAANDGPIAAADSAATTEDTAVIIDVLDNDSDIDLTREGDDLTILSTSGVDHGSVVLDSNKKKLTFTPSANWTGTEVFNYIVKDTANAQATAAVTVTVSAVNDTPIAINDSTTTTEDTPIWFDVIANDTDVDLANGGDTLTVVMTTGVDNGVTNLSSDKKSILFTPDLHWTGTEVFTYLMKDSADQTATATFTVVVTPVNDSPAAVNDAVTIDEDHSVTVDVLTNDSDPDLAHEGDTLTIKSVSGVDNGSVIIAEDFKSLSFTPTANWTGSETFAYVIKDASNVEASANVTITVNPINDPPLAVNDTLSTNEDVPLVMNLLSNDTDVDLSFEGDNLVIVSTAGVEHGAVVVAGDKKSLTFTPATNWNGSEEFTYTINDKSGESSTATVYLTVAAQDDVSVANPDTATVNEEGSVTIDVLANDVEADVAPEDANLTIESISGVDHGIVTIASDLLSLSFAPAANWTGIEVFYYTMKDSKNATSTTTVTVTVNPINDPPTAVDDKVTTTEDTAGTILALANDTDVDLAYEGDALTIISLGTVTNGTAVIASGGKSILFTPTSNWNGDSVFTYTMEDKAHLSSSATITVSVTPVNDPPVLTDIPDQTMEEDTTSSPITFSLTDADTLAANVTLTAASSNEQIVPNASLVLSGSGANRTLAITPLANMNTFNTGPFTITLTASDGTKTISDTFKLTVTPKNDPPVAAADSTRLNEDTTVTINPLANDSDIDLTNEGDELIIVSVSGVDNASVQITNSGKSLLIAPVANWFGTETFQYTIKDRGGLQATANVTVVVDDIAETAVEPILEASFLVTSPKAGEWFKDGQTIHVTWTKVNQKGVSYQLQFFDGVSWSTLANGLKTTEYDHILENTQLHTNAARYQVVASSTNPQSLLAVGEFFVIDNLAPRDVQIVLSKSDRSPYTSGSWTNLPVDILVSGGWDLTGIELKLYDGSKLLGTNASQLGARISTQGTHAIKVIAVDPLGNQTAVGEWVINIDLEPPAVPTLIAGSVDGVKTGGRVTFKFSDDPGLSGNKLLILPDGAEVKIDGDYTWNSVQDGVYTFITIDLAGNRRTLIIAVTGGEMIVQEDSAELPDIAPPDGTITIDEASVQSGALSGASSGSGYPLRSLGLLFCGWFLGLLLIILVWPNVKIIYSYRRPDGKIRKVTHYKRVFTPNNKELKIKVKDAESYDVTFSRWLTRSMRGGSLTIRPENVKLSNPLVEVPDNAKNKFRSSF